jgi:hypothetical protein
MHSHDRTFLASLAFADKQNPKHDWACQYIGQKDVILKLARKVSLRREGKRKSGVEMKLESVSGTVDFEAALSKGEGKYKTTVGFLDLSCVLDVCLVGDYVAELSLLNEIRDAGGMILKLSDGALEFWVPQMEFDLDSSELDGLSFGERLDKKAQHQKKAEGLIVDLLDRFGARLEQRKATVSDLLGSCSGNQWLYQATKNSKAAYRDHLVIEVKINPVPVGDILRQLNLYREYLGNRWENKPVDGVAFALVTAFPLSAMDAGMLEHSGVFHFTLGSAFATFCEQQAGAARSGDVANSPEL